jgi:predicted nuclease of predicted toxin-antitoxin system
MKFKLDENFDVRLTPLVAEGGFEVDTVLGENLSGKRDENIYEVCKAEKRVLITLDLDFANPLRFPPELTEGIIVIRPVRPILSVIRDILKSTLPKLKASDLRGKLWIVEIGSIRVYDPSEKI